MDWKYLFLSANGRIGQKDFWLGFLILFVAGMILGLIPILGLIISIAMIYPWVCLYAKRLHDFGKTGWLQLIPYGVGVVAITIGVMMGGAAALSGGDGAGMFAALGAMMGFIAIAGLVSLGFLLWVGLSKGDPGENRYGPPHPSVFGETPAAA